MSSVDAAILGLSQGNTLVPVDRIAIKAVAVSILSALIGVCFTCWLYIVYYSQDGDTFRVSAGFFCTSSVQKLRYDNRFGRVTL